MVTDKEFRDHWERQSKTLTAIARGLWLAGALLVSGGIWVGTIEANVADHGRRIVGIESEIKPVARLDERLIAQQTQLNRIERLLEHLSGTPPRPMPYSPQSGQE